MANGPGLFGLASLCLVGVVTAQVENIRVVARTNYLIAELEDDGHVEYAELVSLETGETYLIDVDVAREGDFIFDVMPGSTVDVQIERSTDQGQGRLPDTELYKVSQLYAVLNASEADAARAGDGDLSGDVTGEQHPDQIGTKRILMININTGSGFDPLMSEAEIEGYFFGPNSFDGKPPATQYMSDMSSGKMTMAPLFKSGAGHDASQRSHIVTIDIPNSRTNAQSCSTSDALSIASAAKSAASAQAGSVIGSLNKFDFISYFLPKASGCAWVGLAYVFPNPPAQAWIAWTQRDGHRKTHMHELGHNMGFGHASQDNGNNGVQSSDEYSDFGCVMGRGRGSSLYIPFSSVFRHMAGWIESQHIRSFEALGGTEQLVKCVRPAETITLNSISDSPFSGTVLIKLPRSPTKRMATDTGTSNYGGTYFVTFRSGSGFDANLGNSDKNKMYVRYHRGPSSGNARFLVKSVRLSNSMLVGAYGQGQSFQDPVSGFKVTLTGIRTVNSKLVGDIEVDFCDYTHNSPCEFDREASPCEGVMWKVNDPVVRRCVSRQCISSADTLCGGSLHKISGSHSGLYTRNGACLGRSLYSCLDAVSCAGHVGSSLYYNPSKKQWGTTTASCPPESASLYTIQFPTGWVPLSLSKAHTEISDGAEIPRFASSVEYEKCGPGVDGDLDGFAALSATGGTDCDDANSQILGIGQKPVEPCYQPTTQAPVAPVTPAPVAPQGCRMSTVRGSKPDYELVNKDPSATDADTSVRCCVDHALTVNYNGATKTITREPGEDSNCPVWSLKTKKQFHPACPGDGIDFQEAYKYCEDNNARLCTASELQAGCGKLSGCLSDTKRLWSSSIDPACPTPSPTLSPTARPTSRPTTRPVVRTIKWSKNKNDIAAASIFVAVGTTVTWDWRGSNKEDGVRSGLSADSNRGALFNSGAAVKKSQFSYTFTQTGKFFFHSVVDKNAKKQFGTVTVTGPPTTRSPTPQPTTGPPTAPTARPTSNPTPPPVASPPPAVSITWEKKKAKDASITVVAGTRVTWVWGNKADGVVSGTLGSNNAGSLFNSGTAVKNSRFTYTFQNAGSFPYYSANSKNAKKQFATITVISADLAADLEQDASSTGKSAKGALTSGNTETQTASKSSYTLGLGVVGFVALVATVVTLRKHQRSQLEESIRAEQMIYGTNNIMD